MTTIVNAQQLTKRFGSLTAVNAVDMQVSKGECLGVLGPNGAGKTTLLRMITGQALPSSGQLTVLGYALPQQAQAMRAQLGVVPQVDNLDIDFTVRANLQMYARYFGLQSKATEQRIDELLEFTALTEKANAAVTNLSGGMKRRLTLARALVNQPQLIIMDEPTTGLDPQARQLLWARLRQLKKQGTTLMLTTHYLEEAERLCDRILLIDHGVVHAEGTPRELIDQHIEAHVVEVYAESITAWQAVTRTGLREELVGETLFCYSNDEQALLRVIEQAGNLQFLHRRANLEDVFLKLTGRELRES